MKSHSAIYPATVVWEGRAKQDWKGVLSCVTGGELGWIKKTQSPISIRDDCWYVPPLYVGLTVFQSYCQWEDWRKGISVPWCSLLQHKLTTADRVLDVETLDKGFTSHLVSLLLCTIFTDHFLTLFSPLTVVWSGEMLLSQQVYYPKLHHFYMVSWVSTVGHGIWS